MNKSGFKSICVKFNEKRGVIHQLFIKQHKIREESNDRPSDLTLFVGNVPPYCSEECLKYIFKECGTIKSVFFANVDAPSTIIEPKNDKPSILCVDEVKGYKLAYVVFNSARSLETVLSWENEKLITIPKNENPLLTGLKKWCTLYNNSFPDPVEMQKEIDEFMARHDKLKEKENLAKKMAESDEEGWVAVTKKSRNPGFARKQSVKNNLIKRLNRKKKKKMLLNFYNFQIKESKMNHLIDLRKKFEEDKKKVETLKTQRKFKPF